MPMGGGCILIVLVKVRRHATVLGIIPWLAAVSLKKWEAGAFIAFCYLIVDVMWPDGSRSFRSNKKSNRDRNGYWRAVCSCHKPACIAFRTSELLFRSKVEVLFLWFRSALWCGKQSLMGHRSLEGRNARQNADSDSPAFEVLEQKENTLKNWARNHWCDLFTYLAKNMISFCQSHESLREVEFKNMFYFLFLFLIKMCGQA